MASSSPADQQQSDGPAINRFAGAQRQPNEVTEQEWQKVLTEEQFVVTRKAGTEVPFTGKFDKHFVKSGKYFCICCGAELFLAEHKFDAGCGWPAFSKSIEGDKNILRLPDYSYGGHYTEVRCFRCNAHLGHVYDKCPHANGGVRYCINSVAIDFVAADKQ